jgi:hypothetical protein
LWNRWAFYYAPLWFCILFITAIMVSVYWTVRRRERDSLGLMRSKEQVNDKRLSPVLKQSNDDPVNKRRMSFVRNRSEMMARASSIVMPKTMARRLSDTSLKSVGTSIGQLATTHEDANHVLETIETFTSAKHQNVEANTFGSRVVFQQSLWYTAAFYASYTFPTINRVLQQVNGSSPYALLLLHAIFFPLQGFFNVLIYRYAFFHRLKQRFSKMPFWERFHLTYRWSFLGPPPNPTARSHLETEESLDITATPASRGSAVASGDGARARAASYDRNSNDISLCNDDVGFRDDAFDPSGDKLMSTVVEDRLLMSYAKFPNMLAEEAVMVSTRYPTMIGEDSYLGMAASELPQHLPNTTSHAPQAFPTMMTDF